MKTIAFALLFFAGAFSLFSASPGVAVASLAGKYTINVHKSTKDFAYVSCGAI